MSDKCAVIGKRDLFTPVASNKQENTIRSRLHWMRIYQNNGYIHILGDYSFICSLSLVDQMTYWLSVMTILKLFTKKPPFDNSL